MATELTGTTARGLPGLVREGAVSATEVVEAHLRRIEGSRTTSRPRACRWRSAIPRGPASSPTVVRRLREAGAILLGRTNCPPY